MADFNFDSLKEIEIPVRYKGKDYVLVEASGEAAAKYTDRIISGTRMEEGKPVGTAGIAVPQLELVCDCLFHTDSNGDRTKQSVSLAVLSKWPNRVIQPLFKKLEEISELIKIDEDVAKNESNDTLDGSD